MIQARKEGGEGSSEEVEDDLGVRGGFEDGATILELVAEAGVVDEVAVVDDGDEVEAIAGEEGLDVVEWGGGGAGSQTKPPATRPCWRRPDLAVAGNFFFLLHDRIWLPQARPGCPAGWSLVEV